MARFLVLDIDGTTATLVAVAGGGRDGPKVEHVQSWPEERSLSAANAESLGQEFRKRLDAAKVAPAPLVLGVPRDRVVLKEVKFPAVPAHEEPAIVRFQAVKELTDTAEDVVIDYHLRENSASGEKRALVLAVKREQIRIAQAFAQAAGLKLAAATPRAYGLVAIARAAVPPPEPGAAVAVLAVGGSSGEFVVFRGDQLFFSRTVSKPALSSDTSLLAELRRNLAVYAGQSPHAPVRALYVAEGGPLRGVADRIRDTLAVPVQPLNPLPAKSDVPAGNIAASLGLARLILAGAMPINFVKPREPKPPTDPHRRPLLIGVAIAASIILLFGIIGWLQISAKDREMVRLRNELTSVTDDINRNDPDVRKWDEVKKWLDSEVVWLDELYDMAARVQDLKKLRIVQLTADPLPMPASSDPRKKTYVARLTVKGLSTTDDRPLAQFTNALVSEGVYKVEPKQLGPNVLGIERREFPLQFTEKFDLEKRPASAYTRHFTAEAPARKGRNRGNPGGGIFELMNFGGGQ